MRSTSSILIKSTLGNNYLPAKISDASPTACTRRRAHPCGLQFGLYMRPGRSSYGHGKSLLRLQETAHVHRMGSWTVDTLTAAVAPNLTGRGQSLCKDKTDLIYIIMAGAPSGPRAGNWRKEPALRKSWTCQHAGQDSWRSS